MAKVIKILFYTFATIFLIWALLAIILSQVGLETKRFNPLIIEQVKKYNEDLLNAYKNLMNNVGIGFRICVLSMVITSNLLLKEDLIKA